ncbi:hypothetical protein PR048_023875 [Dryococelus australis]|uniref:Uncharacterized protein n=1 Tax=Dryococelus australis TaxID=614101 RepID=A0ABQ9GVB4_9NEOP|nr:hypothetical protein PR048_023875 [Dryococelus australis]
MWNLDAKVQWPQTESGNKYVLIFTEFTTRYFVAKAAPSIDAPSKEHEFAIYRIPQVSRPYRELNCIKDTILTDRLSSAQDYGRCRNAAKPRVPQKLAVQFGPADAVGVCGKSVSNDFANSAQASWESQWESRIPVKVGVNERCGGLDSRMPECQPAAIFPGQRSPSGDRGRKSRLARAEKCGSDKDDTATSIKCAIASKRKAPNWRVAFSLRCVFLWDASATQVPGISDPGSERRQESVTQGSGQHDL